MLSKQNQLDQQSVTFLDMKVDLQVGVYGFGSEALRKGDWWHSMMRVLMGREDPEETQKRLQSLNKYVTYLKANHIEKFAARTCSRPSILGNPLQYNFESLALHVRASPNTQLACSTLHKKSAFTLYRQTVCAFILCRVYSSCAETSLCM